MLGAYAFRAYSIKYAQLHHGLRMPYLDGDVVGRRKKVFEVCVREG